jgi:hypothetical protein
MKAAPTLPSKVVPSMMESNKEVMAQPLVAYQEPNNNQNARNTK